MPGWCEKCQNTGWVNCYCGGDLCICENGGEMECPVCHADPYWDDVEEGFDAGDWNNEPEQKKAP